MKNVHKIVLTGGPCAGKTTALSWISNYFGKVGWRTLIVNEAATELITSGIYPTDFDDPLFFQKLLIRTQMAKEQNCVNAAYEMKGADKILIVCDRGIRDNKAYMSNQDFHECLRGIGLTALQAVDSYDAVFHLVTAADGAEEFYTLANNTARSEGLEEARALDRKTQNAWVGHPHLRIIKNEGSFEDKLKKLLAEISVVLGEPEPFEIERKYLIEYPNLELLRAMPNCQEVEILQTYLRGSDENDEVRVRQRGVDGNYIFTKTIKRWTPDPSKRVEIEKRISRDEYVKALMEAYPGANSIRKTRFCVMQRDSGQYLEIDVYPTSDKYAILEVEFNSTDDELIVPDFIKVIKEVTGNEAYYNNSIAFNSNRLPEEL
ncbi:MAG: AAA family ATPase [Candidatus Saccharibacteria bacterium]|nr:AAA family ATPase [Candidatus Saccharibacteria bacterium]